MSSTNKMTVGEVIEVYEALLKLDGFMKNGNANPYEFDEQTRWNISKNIRLLKAEYTQWDESRMAKVMELSPVHRNLNREDPAVYETFRLWTVKKRKLETTVNGILHLKRSLLLASGPIAVSIISDLMLIIDDDGPSKTPDPK